MTTVLYIGFWPKHNLDTDILNINVFKNNNYILKSIPEIKDITENDFINNDIIICGSFMYNINIISLIFNYKHKVIYNITEPIEYNNKLMYLLYINNHIELSFGCVPENNTNIKFPLYIDPDNLISCNKIIEINDYINNIDIDTVLNKNYCCLINRHDLGNTRTHIYNKLASIGTIICPSELFNNFSNTKFEEIGRETFQKQFIFCICPENYCTELNGYVTEKLFWACCSGNIPIYYGKLDDYDKLIFNINRIILFDPNSEESMNNAYNFIIELLSDKTKLYNFYKQKIFLDTAYNAINNFKLNLKNRITKFINNINSKSSSSNELNNTDKYYINSDKNNNIEEPNKSKNDYNYKLLNYNELLNYTCNIQPSSNYKGNIIITIETTDYTLKSQQLYMLINSLNNQLIKPKYILIKVNLDNPNIEPYNIINKDYSNLFINCYYSNNNLQLIENIKLMENSINNFIDDNDKIIFIKDSMIVNKNFLLMYELCYQLYNCNGVCINNNNDNIIFYDHYNNKLNIDLSYSFIYKYIKDITNETNSNIDDILYNYYIKNNLYVCGINLESDNKQNIPTVYQQDINLDEDIYINLESINYSRTLLYNVDNIDYDPFDNDYLNKQIDIKYFNDNIIIITITYFNKITKSDFIKYKDITIEYINTDLSNKITLFLYTNNAITYIPHKTYNCHLFQFIDSFSSSNINLHEFYSILTILNYIPDIDYKLINNTTIENYTNKYSILYNLYNKINDTIGKLDLFKAWYLYNNGGLYIGYKSILYNKINDLLNLDEFYSSEVKDNTISCNILFNKEAKNLKMKIYLINICYNIFKSNYTNNILSVSNSELLEKIITDPLLKMNNIDILNKYTIIKNNNKILLLSYNSNKILTSFKLWKNNYLFNDIIINNSKINGIDHIAWINLDKCEHRKDHMNSILNNIDIPNTRISGIDGTLIDLSSLNYLERPLTNIEKAVTLSHIKAINYLKYIDGNYFCICEDDIILDNIILFNCDLKYIIDNAPEFDILLLHKVYDESLSELYTKWNDTIYGASCYIISRNGINKITEFSKYNSETNSFNINKKISIADWFLFNNINTYVYKYNYIDTSNKESTIHSDHLNIHIKSSLKQLEVILDNFINE